MLEYTGPKRSNKVKNGKLGTLTDLKGNKKVKEYILSDEIEEIGLNGETDWMDRQHLNCYGQAKFTRYMAEQGYLGWE